MLTALERSELLERDDDGSYVAGSLFWLYAARHDPGEDLVRLARPTLERSASRPTRPSTSASPAATACVQVAQVDSRFILGTRDWTQVDVPAHCSSLGKVFFAWGVVDAARRAAGPADRPPPSPTAAALPRRARAHAEPRLGRRPSTSSRSGSSGIAVPVLGPRGQVVAALGVSGPTPAAGRTVRRGRAAV